MTLGAEHLIRVKDSGKIPSGIPTPHIPQLSLLSSLDLIAERAAVAVIVLVQGTGVAEAAPELRRLSSDPNRDFIAQGVGNVASGLFRGQPVGGSVSQTALNVAAGARSRWASIFSGVWMLLDPRPLLRCGREDPDPDARGGSDLRRGQLAARRADRHGPAHRAAVAVAFAVTFVATILLPVPAAVGIGVGLSLLLQVNQEPIDLTVVRLARGERSDSRRDTGAARHSPAARSRCSTSTEACCSPAPALCRRASRTPPEPSCRSSCCGCGAAPRSAQPRSSCSPSMPSGCARPAGTCSSAAWSPTCTNSCGSTHRVDLQDAVTVVPASDTILESTQQAYDDAEAWLGVHTPE